MSGPLNQDGQEAIKGAQGSRRRRELLIDVLPEQYQYRDDGCDVASSCLSCPLPKCKYDDPGWYQQSRLAQRDGAILRVREAEGLTVPELARRFGVSERTVFRALQRGRRRGGPLLARRGPPEAPPEELHIKHTVKRGDNDV